MIVGTTVCILGAGGAQGSSAPGGEGWSASVRLACEDLSMQRSVVLHAV